jgi:glutamyl-tRNA synthetase
VNSKWTNEAVTVISEFKEALKNQESITFETAKTVLNEILEKNQVKIGKVLQALRLAVTGAGAGPDLMQIIEIIGKEDAINRIEKALETLSNKIKV